MKHLTFLFLLVLTATSCKKDNNDVIKVTFMVKNELMWNIGHDYKIKGIDASGKAFESSEQYVTYLAELTNDQTVQNGSTITLYRDNNVFWTSDPIKKSCTITYTDSAFEDYVNIN